MMNATRLEPLLLRPIEAADLLAVSRAQVYALIAAGALPSIMIGKRKRIPLDALRRLVEQQKSEAQQEVR